MNHTKTAVSQPFLDQNQYSLKSILKYERIFGHTWVSTGGEDTTKEFLTHLSLSPGQRVLDVGCGTGGSAFYMARYYGVHVHGVDLSTNMIQIAQDRLSREDKKVQELVQFEIADITTTQVDSQSYDVIYSRDTILHIFDKESLYRTMLGWLRPGGKLLVTDYCRGTNNNPTQEFLEYVKQRDYDLRTVAEYGEVLRGAGFKNVKAHDKTSMFIDILNKELKFFTPTREAFVRDFSENDYNGIVNGWTAKVGRCRAGEQAWGLFEATK